GIPNVPYLGRVTDPVRLVQILNATKMWVVDNLFESDSTMAHEAISCGAKVAAFKSFWTKEICQRFLPGFYELDVTPILSPFDILSDPQNEACAKAKINLEALGQGIAEALSDNKIPNATFVHNHSPKKWPNYSSRTLCPDRTYSFWSQY
ncbi:MAG: hypothetical protein KKF80_03805, partial [Candidatus Omnitrophica bacterium]|nr:hypothetical protein [Candidatus Omnitrophota bacterium]